MLKRKLHPLRTAEPYLYLIPSLILLCVFLFYPMLDSFRISLTDWNGLVEANFIGVQNFAKLFKSDDFWTSIKITFIWVAMSVVIWALSYFPRNDEMIEQARERFLSEQTVPAETVPEEKIEAAVDATLMENSYLGRFGKFIQPVFEPCGFDWRITVGLLGSFPARELIISTLGITYSLGGDVDEESDDLFEKMLVSTHADGRPVFTIPVIIGLMVFFALCMQCIAEVVVLARETSWKWAALSWTQMTVLAWLAATFIYQVGSLF